MVLYRYIKLSSWFYNDEYLSEGLNSVKIFKLRNETDLKNIEFYIYMHSNYRASVCDSHSRIIF